MSKTKMISFFLLYAAAILFSQPTDGTEGRGSAARDAKANSRGNFAREQLDPKDRERLFAAVAAGDKPTTAALLEKTKDVDLCNTSGYTLLHWAVLTKQKEIAALLISRGAGVQAPLSNGSTALHTAAFTGNRDLVQLLIDHGAHVYAVDQLEKRPFDVALELGHHGLLPLLKPLHRAVEKGDLGLAKTIMESAPASLKTRDESTLTPLHVAVGGDRRELVQALVEKGADINARGPCGATPLRMAVEAGRDAIAAFLRENGALDLSDDLLLQKTLREKEAVVWYLFDTGWVIKTKNHLLIFDYVPRAISALPPSVPSCLSSGDVNPRQIREQKVTAFVPIIRDQNHVDTHLSWKKEIQDLTYVFGEDKVRDSAVVYIPPRERRLVKGMEIQTIGTTGYGEGFVVTVDGLTIFYAGDHESNEPSWDLFTREIDFLKGRVPPIDMVFLQMIFEEQHRSSRGVLYALEKLKPAVMFPNSALAVASFFGPFVRQAAALQLKTEIRSAALRGDLFFYFDGPGRTGPRITALSR